MNFEAMPKKGQVSAMEGENIPKQKIEKANARLAMEQEGESPVYEIKPAEEETILEEMSPEDRREIEALRSQIGGLRVAEKSPLNRLDNIFAGGNKEVISALTAQLNKFKKEGEIKADELRYCLRKALETRDRITAADANEKASYEQGMNKLVAAMEILGQTRNIDTLDIITNYNEKMKALNKKIKQAA